MSENKEKKIASEVVAGVILLLCLHKRFRHLFHVYIALHTVTVGPKSSQEVLRTALAMVRSHYSALPPNSDAHDLRAAGRRPGNPRRDEYAP